MLVPGQGPARQLQPGRLSYSASRARLSYLTSIGVNPRLFVHRPTEGLDTLAILKGEKAGDRHHVRGIEQEKNETNPISYNQHGINGLRRISGTAARTAQQNLSDRSTGYERKHRPEGRATPGERCKLKQQVCRPDPRRFAISLQLERDVANEEETGNGTRCCVAFAFLCRRHNSAQGCQYCAGKR